ncbi:hypothetical protein RRG08_047280 [Elysia crispata]|uniref:Uncharacterized protein n=1 Tax=Elysia crispata TaxID=231223 RepID=A0AAE1DDR8_9GAST|nr:hypothetical protein RRG08_047280 [Elysia crispata]
MESPPIKTLPDVPEFFIPGEPEKYFHIPKMLWYAEWEEIKSKLLKSEVLKQLLFSGQHNQIMWTKKQSGRLNRMPLSNAELFEYGRFARKWWLLTEGVLGGAALVLNTRPPLALVLNTRPPLALVLNTRPPLALVLNTRPPLALVLNTRPPLALVLNTRPPLALVLHVTGQH